MIIIVTKKITKDETEKVAEDFDGYIKVVVDIKQKILAAGGERHFDAEQKLLENGSIQKDLWGGGFDLETKEIDYNSIINLRPAQENPSRDIMSSGIRRKFDKIVKDLIL